MANTTYPDCIATVFASTTQKLGDIIVQSPLGGDQLAQVLSTSEFTGPPPSGIFDRYTNRFDDTTYYYLVR